jgi:hypothetical protein
MISDGFKLSRLRVGPGLLCYRKYGKQSANNYRSPHRTSSTSVSSSHLDVYMMPNIGQTVSGTAFNWRGYSELSVLTMVTRFQKSYPT